MTQTTITDTMTTDRLHDKWVCGGCSANVPTVHQITDGEGMWLCAACVERIDRERLASWRLAIFRKSCSRCGHDFGQPTAERWDICYPCRVELRDAGKTDALRSFRTVVSVALLALTLSPVSANTPTFQQPVFPTAHYLAGCELEYAGEDGSRIIYCPEDGATLRFDPDGNRFVNDAGAPIHGVGWFVVS